MEAGRKARQRMNNAVLSGRLTRDAEIRYSQGESPTAIARFTLAVGDYNSTDFISCKALGKQAEWLEKWTKKGTKVELTGKIKTGSYESKQTGQKVYYTEVLVNSVAFGESRAEAEARQDNSPVPQPDNGGFMNIPDGMGEELPFN